MNQVAEPKQVHPVVRFKQDLQRMIDGGEFALPSTVDPDAFRNAAIVAFQDSDEIRKCSPESIFKSLRTLAGAGLMPDGREAAIVRFGGSAQAMPMVAGLIKVARNSGKVASLWADVIYEGESLNVWVEDGVRQWDHVLTDGSRIDAMSRGGAIRGAYAVSKMTDGSIDFQPMSKEEIEKRRKASPNQKSDDPTGIWGKWYDEMAKKTVIRNLAKRLPMSTEDVERIMREQDTAPIKDVTPTREATVPLSQRLKDAKEEAEAEPLTGEIMDDEKDGVDEAPDDDVVHWTEAFEHGCGFPGSDAWNEGQKSFTAALPITTCPHEDDPEKAADWIGGWYGAQRAAE